MAGVNFRGQRALIMKRADAPVAAMTTVTVDQHLVFDDDQLNNCNNKDNLISLNYFLVHLRASITKMTRLCRYSTAATLRRDYPLLGTSLPVLRGYTNGQVACP